MLVAVILANHKAADIACSLVNEQRFESFLSWLKLVKNQYFEYIRFWTAADQTIVCGCQQRFPLVFRRAEREDNLCLAGWLADG